MALQYIRFTELDAVSSAAVGDIIPLVEAVTNLNKKISVQDLSNSIPVVSELTKLSAEYVVAYSNLVTNSAAYLLSGTNINATDIPALSGNWNTAYTNLVTYSAAYLSGGALGDIPVLSATWNTAYTNLVTNSAAYLLSGSDTRLGDIPTLSGSWNSTYTTVNTNSSTWSFAYVRLTGDTMTGGLSALTLSAARTLTVGGGALFASDAGNTGIGTVTPNERLTVTGNVSSTGTGFFNHVAANTKSFYIQHPSKPGLHLQYGSLESPYHGIRITGQDVITGSEITVQLPDYTNALVHAEGANIQITNIDHDKPLFVKGVNITHNNFVVGLNRKWLDKSAYKFYWSFSAIRKDIPHLQVEV